MADWEQAIKRKRLQEEMINNKEVTLCDFINQLYKISEGYDHYRVTKIINRKDLKDEKFLKWETSSHDSDEALCPLDCYNCHIPDPDDEENYECNKIELNYYVSQWTTNMDGDSYQGNLVYPLKDHYVFVDYNC